MSNQPDPTFVAAPPSDSVLLTLARAAMAEATADGPSFPRLDLSDPGQRRFGDYELLEEIGRGGMGVVYRAHQHSLDREVAIKFIASGLADADGVARFLSEARAAARLAHPRIVPVHEVGSLDGLHYFSMPLVRGCSLSRRLHDDGPLPAEDAVSLLLALCDAIAYAHGLGLLHLDLKPANILFDDRGEPLVADFGLARHVDDRGGVDAQEVSGTPAYMAPEQILIRQYRLTGATDLYALGAILYRCLTGCSPHGGGEADEIIRRAVAGRIVPPRQLKPRLAPDLGAVCLKCLELEPKDRYGSVQSLADDLRRVRDGLPVSVRRAGIGERALRWCRREPRLAAATAAAVGALLAGVLATGWQWREAAVQRDLAVAGRDAAEVARQEAESARRIAEESAALGAWLFAEQMGEFSNRDWDAARARNGALLQWLRDRHPADEAKQAEVLVPFVHALEAAEGERGDFYTESLFSPLVTVLGAGYRQQVVDALLAGDDPQRFLFAARLAWIDERSDPDAPRLRELMDLAIAHAPGDPLVWHTAALLCPGEGEERRCHWPGALDRLAELDPDNAYPWLRMFIERDGREAREALREAAKRSRFEDPEAYFYEHAFAPWERSGVPPPPLLREVSGAYAPGDPAEGIVVAISANTSPMPAWSEFHGRCLRSRDHFRDPTVFADCVSASVLMMRGSGSWSFPGVVGARVIRHVVAEGPLREEADAHWRDFVYVSETLAGHRGGIPRERRDTRRFYGMLAHDGELAAFAATYGFPRHPPPDWQPREPASLLRSEDLPPRE